MSHMVSSLGKKVIVAIICLLFQIIEAEEYLLSSPLGTIKGLSHENQSYLTFKGIRFGEYPQRFEPSVMVEKLTEDGVYDATEFGASCPQKARINIGNKFSEDCLFLNVWAPPIKENAKLKVMVFIHGGAYIQGSGNEIYIDGIDYAKKGSILVTINYRLGLYGFFAHPELTRANPENPTNFGLLDQILALKWIKKYISHFGGDPDDLTVFGESAGGTSVQWLMVHKDHAANPLFTSAILQSPPSSSYPHELKEAEVMGDDFASQIGCAQPNAIACLRNLTSDDFLAKVWARRSFALAVTPLPYSPTRIASPHVDNNFPEHPSKRGISGDAKAHNVIIGVTAQEWNLFMWINHMFMQPSDEWMHKSVSLVFSSPHFQNLGFTNLTERLEELYPRKDFESGVDRVTAIYTDMIFSCPCRSYARLASTQGANVYFYVFSHTAEFGNKKLRAFHASELPFVFQKRTPEFLGGLIKLFPSNYTDDEVTLSNSIIGSWTALGSKDLKFGDKQWPGFTVSSEKMLEISIPSNILDGKSLDAKCEFWDEVVPAPQKAIHFDVMEHEPFLLKAANEYSLDLLVFVGKHSKFVGAGILIGIVLLVARCCRRKPSKKQKTA